MSIFFTTKRKFFLSGIGILLALNIVVWKEVFVSAGHRYLKVDFFDVGQGDSIFIETPGGNQILIDGGPDSVVLGKLAEKMPFWDRSLDAVILTHPDKDHVMGIISVLEKYGADYIIWTGIVKNGGLYQKWLQVLEEQKKRGAKIVIAEAGQKIRAGDIVIGILHPFENLAGKDFGSKDNDSGVVSHLDFGETDFLFAADISSSLEKKIIESKENLATAVLKIAHHGSKYSTSEEFLRAANPKTAVISAGKNNSYGHPTEEVLQKLKKFGIKIFRTDENGDIEMLSDGESITIK